jgi:hypothetical protein
VLITPDGRVIRGNRTARRWMQGQAGADAGTGTNRSGATDVGAGWSAGERLRLAMAQAAGGRIVKLELNSLDDRGAPAPWR